MNVNWINIKDKLPPVYEDVCVKTDSGLMCVTYRYSNSEHPEFDFVNVNHVTHWCPLEKAPSLENNRTNREWLNSLSDMQLSLFMTVGLPCYNLIYDFDVILSIKEFKTPRELREWLESKQNYTYEWKYAEYYEEKEISL